MAHPVPQSPKQLDQAVDAFFAPGGPLSRVMDAYEPRPGQVTMARAVAAAIDQGHKLVVEAGTGTGKTLAYLVPALASGLKVVISTGTKQLQEQLLQTDLPIVQAATGKDFDVLLMKGRTNYLCESRYIRYTRQGTLTGAADFELLHAIGEWRQVTKTGDRAELEDLPDDHPLWRELTVTSEQCPGRKCEDYETCWVTELRRRAQEAQVIVVNHHLYFADAALRLRSGAQRASVLPPRDLAIFDEAHELDEVAAQHLGVQVSERRIIDLVREVVKAALDPKDRARLAIIASDTELATGRLFDALPYGNGRGAMEVGQLSEDFWDRAQRVDEMIAYLAAEADTRELHEGAQLVRRCDSLRRELSFALGRDDALAHLPPDLPGTDEPQVVLDDAETPPPSSLETFAPPPFVRFTERAGRRRVVVARPLDPAPYIRGILGDLPTVMTSATLAISGSFAHFQAKVGLDETDGCVAPSPFDYPRQALLYLPQDLPDPNDPTFGDAAIRRVIALTRHSGGGAFVLCTSHRMLQLLGAALRQQTAFDILVQGSAPKHHLVERFKAAGDAILVGTMSFWRGVDVPGRCLRLVIIDKLPFASPGDPVVKAQIDHIETQGRSAFGSYQLPRASLLLRQGFGRLIRSQSDRGVVAILDGRITQKGYGRNLLKGLPPARRTSVFNEAVDFLEEMLAVDAASPFVVGAPAAE